MKQKAGKNQMNTIIQEVDAIEKEIQAKAGVAVVEDGKSSLHWEMAYHTLFTEDDSVTITPAEPTSGAPDKQPGSIIDLTAASEEDLSGI